MNKLNKLLENCKCGVFLTVNQHRDYYETAEESLLEAQGHECPPDIADDVREIMEKTNTIVELQFYPNTPIGSYSIYHYDVEQALDEALTVLNL